MYKIAYFLFLIILNFSVFAQATIYGKITNKQEESLPFATVFLKNNKIGTYTNFNGDFQLKNSADNTMLYDTLVVSYVGYKTAYYPIPVGKDKQIKLKLERDIVVLKEVTISAHPLTGKEIISKTIKKIKDNYMQSPVTIEGFYSEKIKENNKWIQLNEAAFDLSYSAYPQRHFQRKSYRAYYEDRYGIDFEFTPGKYFGHSQYFPYHTPINDRLKILGARISQNKSKFSQEPAPIGGPIDLISADKVKYLYDFLDPKILKKYIYKLNGYTIIKGKTSYVVQFYPNPKYKELVYQPLNKKMKFAVYSGSCFIDCSSFAIVGFECQFASGADLRVYENSMPSISSLIVNYQQINDKWIIENIRTKQFKHIVINGKSVEYYCERNLNLSDTIKRNGSSTYPFPERLDENCYATLRYYPKCYKPSFWKEYVSQKLYIVPDSDVLNDLEKDIPLELQFQNHFIPIDSIPTPLVPIVELYSGKNVQKDSLQWLENKNDSTVIQYLKEENKYAQKVFMQLKDYKREFYLDMVRMFEKDTSKNKDQQFVMSQKPNGNTYLYKKITTDSLLQLLNITEISEGKTNFYLEDFSLNPKNNKIIYTYSEKGNIAKTLIIKDIPAHKNIDTLKKVNDFVWLNNSNFIYTQEDVRDRSDKAFNYKINSRTKKLLYFEEDSTYDISLKFSYSKDYIFIVSESLDETEVRFIPIKSDTLKLNLIRKRRKGVSYLPYHFLGDNFLILTNENNPNYELAVSPINNVNNKWDIVIKGEGNEIIEDVLVTKDYYILKTFKDNRPALKCVNKQNNSGYYFPFDEEFYDLEFGIIASFEHNKIELDYESRITPFKKLWLDISNRKDSIVDEVKLSDRFNVYNYKIKQVFAKSFDGEKIPITIFYKQSDKESKGLILKAYGAYGAKNYPQFSTEDLVYVKNGFTIAYAHVRGGSDKGYDWYKSGKRLNKLNTFKDYIAAANFLIKKNYVISEKLVGYGTSAGGLIMGYVANNQPLLFNTLILDRPFLDVINTMRRDSLALTTEEYKEWGNPNNKTDFDYITTYSPYQNIKRQKYPNLFFTSMFFDRQTPFWQIAKSVAKLREYNTGDNLIIMNTNWESGHRGSVIWDKQVNKFSNQYAFIMYCIYDKYLKPEVTFDKGFYLKK